MNKLNLIITNQQDEVEISDEIQDAVSKVVEKVIEQQGILIPVEISLVFTDDERICELNRNFRDKDIPTDVLSFPQLEFEKPGVIQAGDYPKEDGYPILPLGDIVISVERAQEQAEMFGHSFMREIGYLTAHSMFHLLGYDHEQEDEKKVMRSKEEAVLNEIGLTR